MVEPTVGETAAATQEESADILQRIVCWVTAYMSVWRITNKVGSDKCQTNHKVGQPFTEIVRPFSDESLQLNKILYFITKHFHLKTAYRIVSG